MKRNIRIERFNTCYKCTGTNTEKVGMIDNFSYYQYVGWCFDCRNHYSYRLDISTVWDRKGRI